MGKDCDCTHHAKTAGDGFAEEVAGLVVGSRIIFLLGERQATIDLRSLAVVRIGGARHVCLADVWAASQLPGDLTDLAFDFVGEDGFRTSFKRAPSSGRCSRMGSCTRADAISRGTPRSTYRAATG